MSKLDEFQRDLEAHECTGEEAKPKEMLLKTIAEMCSRGSEYEGDAGVFATIVEFLRGKILKSGDDSWGIEGRSRAAVRIAGTVRSCLQPSMMR